AGRSRSLQALVAKTTLGRRREHLRGLLALPRYAPGTDGAGCAEVHAFGSLADQNMPDGAGRLGTDALCVCTPDQTVDSLFVPRRGRIRFSRTGARVLWEVQSAF